MEGEVNGNLYPLRKSPFVRMSIKPQCTVNVWQCWGSEDFPCAKTRHHGLKMGQNHLFEHPEWSWITFEKMRFSPICDPFLVPKRPVFKKFWDFPWPKTRHHGLKTA